jgi:pyruvate carboxylase
MQYEINGIRRDITVADKTIKVSSDQVKYADFENRRHVGSSIPGAISKVYVKKGDEVEVNQPLFIIEAMKMETSVVAQIAGVVDDVLVKEGQFVKAGELLAELK